MVLAWIIIPGSCLWCLQDGLVSGAHRIVLLPPILRASSRQRATLLQVHLLPDHISLISSFLICKLHLHTNTHTHIYTYIHTHTYTSYIYACTHTVQHTQTYLTHYVGGKFEGILPMQDHTELSLSSALLSTCRIVIEHHIQYGGHLLCFPPSVYDTYQRMPEARSIFIIGQCLFTPCCTHVCIHTCMHFYIHTHVSVDLWWLSLYQVTYRHTHSLV